MKRISNLLSPIVLTILLTLALISCGGGGSSDSSSTSDDTSSATSESTGTVGILLTDKPADPDLFLSMNATIEQVELLGPEGEGSVVLYDDTPQTVDLLRLRNESIPFTFRDDVPVGTYCKIRLILSDLELVLVDDTPDDLTDNETHRPNLPGNGKLDLVVRGCFTVDEGNVITVQVDLDGGNSIHIVENNQGYSFRPVVFVDVLEEGFESKLVRLSGEISEVMPDENALLLCDALPVQGSNNMECVEVRLGDDSAFFDNLNYTGTPRPLSELLVETMVGQQITVIGKPDHHVASSTSVDIPPGHLPPPGECRLWEEGVPPGLQSAPGDCEELEDDVTDDTVLVDHDGVVGERYHPLMEVDALVVELGEFFQLEGSVNRDSDTSGFAMTVSAGDGFIAGTLLEVVHQIGQSGINGTRVVSKSGDRLTPLDILVPRQVQIDGVVDSSATEDTLNAALVIVDTESDDEDSERSGQITGTVVSAGADGFVLAPTTDTVCGVATTDLQVTLAEDVAIITVVITDTVSEITQGGTIQAGQSVGVDGSCNTDGYLAESVAIVDDQRDL
ncbi:MAG: DUF4382 domain-containing protein [Candidatus Thiodiazotropha lotti]|nr:DUF4382 domain-containing protein [Candidatus Thiodiazotropha lotti]MCG7932054.1 DUF4382 domain-containing protein [Candidatus Thiodiazotropha lotti]MCW4221904.1 DUF4382 domain-containing protein [Candidatus Thiodiazotropha lotti]